jgi:hypothetical protein
MENAGSSAGGGIYNDHGTLTITNPDIRSLPAVAGNPRPATGEALAKAGFQKITAFSV